MPDVQRLSDLAITVGLDFTGFLTHTKIEELANFWLPNVNFHEIEMFHSLDLADLYDVPGPAFQEYNELEQQEFAIEVDGIPAAPPVLRSGSQLHANGENVRDALDDEDVHFGAVYSHGGNTRAADKFFGSETDVPTVGNPTLPRHGLRARVEFRMLLETLKQDLALAAMQDADDELRKPVDAIWGDFDVTDLLLRRVDESGGDIGPAGRGIRHQFARDLIAAFEAEDPVAVQALLQSPPPDTSLPSPAPTRANQSVWSALSTCGLLEYHFIYAYNDFSRYGGFYTNEHEGDNEGCCLVFERERLKEYQAGDIEMSQVSPLGLITSAHEPADRADDSRSVDSDPGDARDGLDVYVALGSHATYLTPGEHDFFSLANVLRKEPALFTAGVIAAMIANPLLLPLILIHSHFKDTKDRTSKDGTTGQREGADTGSDPETHLEMNLVVTPLGDTEDASVYDLARPDNPSALALRAFGGRLGAHDGIKDKSPHWENKTRRYFLQLIAAISSGKFREPIVPVAGVD